MKKLMRGAGAPTLCIPCILWFPSSFLAPEPEHALERGTLSDLGCSMERWLELAIRAG